MAAPDADPYAEPEAAIRCYERWSALSVTIHDREGRIGPYLPPTRHWHMTPLCQAMKHAHGERCLRWDDAIAHASLALRPEGSIRRCHAGLVEITVPLLERGTLAAVLFAGQRTADLDLRIDAQDDLASELAIGHAQPERLGQADAVHLLEGLRQLGARLCRWRDQVLGAAVAGRVPPPRDRRQAILGFIADRHHLGIGLDELARHLGLSRHRAAHVVRAACGRSFIDLLTDARLRSACAMLAHTNASVAEIAGRSGFGDPDHFHRVFRARVGTTPGAYRRQPVRDA